MKINELNSICDFASLKENILDIKNDIRQLKSQACKTSSNIQSSLPKKNQLPAKLDDSLVGGACALPLTPFRSHVEVNLRSPLILEEPNFNNSNQFIRQGRTPSTPSEKYSPKKTKVNKTNENHVPGETGARNKVEKPKENSVTMETGTPKKKQGGKDPPIGSKEAPQVTIDKTFALVAQTSSSADKDQNLLNNQPVNTNGLLSSKTKVDSEGFTLVANKRYSNSKRIVGKKNNNSHLNFKSAIKVAEFYVGQCDLTVTSGDITSYITDELGISIKSIAELNSRNPSANSFKICIPFSHKDSFLSENIWLEGHCYS